ncbi:MAG: gspJ [Betaproteobacteria bacterium]|jgi:general secretion pathway protein J|nr:gspJ [Betaproteobacteria bacterium]
MTLTHNGRACGFTLIELLAVLLILSLLAVMSHRGLSAVLESRDHVRQETDKWQTVAAFFARFERDLRLAAPRSVRGAPAWQAGISGESHLEFSRFASVEGVDSARRVGYRLNDRQEIELSLSSGLDLPVDRAPARYPLLSGVAEFNVAYLGAARVWAATWPGSALDAALPRAVRVRVVLVSGEELVRVFELAS